MRILSLHPAATELLFALGAGGHIVGRCDNCTYPESALTIPSIGDAQEVTAESAAILEADLIVLGPDQDALAERLVALTPITLRFASLDGSLAEIGSLAKMLGKDVEAEVLSHDLRTLFERIKEKAARFHTTRVYAESLRATSSISPLMNDLIVLAGGTPYAGPINIDEIKRFDPQMIVIAIPGDESEFDPTLIAARDGWSDLAAVKNERVFAIDDALLLRPGPRIAQGVKQLAKILHGITVNGN